MPGTAASESIFFTATIFIAVVLAGMFTGIIYDFADNIDERGDELADAMLGSISIIVDPQAVPYSDLISDPSGAPDTVTIYVLNSGETNLPALYASGGSQTPDVVVLVDGEMMPITSMTIQDRDGDGQPDTEWVPGTWIRVRFQKEGLDVNEDHTMTVYADTGKISDSIMFRLVVV